MEVRVFRFGWYGFFLLDLNVGGLGDWGLMDGTAEADSEVDEGGQQLRFGVEGAGGGLAFNVFRFKVFSLGSSWLG